MLFEKTRNKINTQINDRVVAPVHTAVIISVVAVIIAGIALMIVVGKE